MAALALSALWPWSRRRRPNGRRGVSTAWYEAHERRRVLWSSAIATIAAVLLGQAVLRVGVAVVIVPVIAAALAAIVWKPKLGLLMVFGLVLLFEMGNPDPLMAPGRYLHYGLQGSLGISGFIASPLELLLILTMAVWIVQGLVRRRLGYRGGDLGWPTLLFFGSLVVGLLRGAAGGGDMYIAFWEVRSLLYLGVGYVMAANLFRTRRDVRALVVVFLVANSLYALEGAFRYVFLIRTGVIDVPQEFTYAHEVVVFLAIAILQAIIGVVVGGPRWMRICAVLVAPIALFTLFATQRRAGSIALAIAFVLIALPWLMRHRKAIMLILIPGLLASAIYLPIFWNNTGFLGQPARAVRSLTAPDDRDASSNDYRALEAVNVRETIRSDPLLGVGFGREFLFVVELPDLSWWPFWRYQPHHNVLWVWLKVGAPGFTVFCILMFGSLALASSRALTLKDPTMITFAYLAIASVVTSLVFSYVDLGMTNGRLTTFLGVVLGVLAVLRRIEEEDPPPMTEKEVEAAGPPAPADPAGPVRRARRPAWSPRPAPIDPDLDEDGPDGGPDPEHPETKPPPVAGQPGQAMPASAGRT